MALYPPKIGAKYSFKGKLYRVKSIDTTVDSVILESLSPSGAVIDEIPPIDKKIWEKRDYIEEGPIVDSTYDKDSKYNDFRFSFDPETGDIIVTYPDGIKTERLKSIRGPKGRSVFEEWCQRKGIKNPTAQDWEDFLAGFKGEDGQTVKGADAPSPYEEWKSRQPKNATEEDKSYNAFINSLKGDKGKDGYEGKDGLSAYDVWKETQPEGKRSIQDYLNYISGKPGKNGESAYEMWLRLYPHEGPASEEDFFRWLASLAAAQAPQGDSYLPSIDKDGKLYFTNSRTGERTAIGHNVLGKDGKTYTPHVHNDYLWYEDENGNRPFPPIHIKGDKGEPGKNGKSAYELWRDDPLHPENAGKTLDDYLQSLKGEDGKVVNIYHNKLAELEDYTCPIQKISPYMIVSTDTLEGSESAEETIELEKARIQGLRAEGEKYANHGSWIQEFFWWCAGADRPLLRMCPGEHSKYMGIGTVIFFTALMAWFSSFVALGLVTGESANPKSTIAIIAPVAILIIGSILTFVGYKRYKLKRLRDHLKNPSDEGIINSSIHRFNHKIWWIIGIISVFCLFLFLFCIWGKGASTYISWAALFACAWSLMIFFLDRFITNTMYSDGKVTISWTELRSALPRIIIAIFLGIIISAPLELNVFKQEVDETLLQTAIRKVNQQYNQEIDSCQILIKNYTDSIENIVKQKPRIAELNNQRLLAQNALQKKYNSIMSKYSPSRPRNKYKNESEEDYQNYLNGQSQKNRNISGAAQSELSIQLHNDSVEIQKLSSEIARLSIGDSVFTENKKATIIYRDSVKNRRTEALDSIDISKAGLYSRLEALHNIAYNDHVLSQRNVEDEHEDFKKWFLGILAVLFITCVPFYQNVTTEKINNKYPPFKWRNWVKGVVVVVPWFVVLSLAAGYCYQTLFFSLPSYIFSAVGMIMMLFILIDVSPVFYKMMLADGVYDKLLHKEKLLAEDAIRLNAAKSFAKVNDSAIGRLAPFVFGKTAGKLMDILKEFKSKSSEIDTNREGRPEMGYGQSQERKDIDKTNSEVFSYVLDLKKRLVKASYLAWYRDMRDHVLATKEDNQNPPGQPEDEFSEFDDNREPDFTVELDFNQLEMLIGATTKLTASVKPQNESTPKVDWQSRDENVAIVSDGEITAISPGITEIIATCGEGFSSCKVIVIQSTSDEGEDGDGDDDDNNIPPSEDSDKEYTQYSGDSSSSETTFGEDSGVNVEEDHNDVDQDEDEEHEIKDDETFRDINK